MSGSFSLFKVYLPKNSKVARFLINIWPPFFFAGIRVEKLTSDFRYCRVVLKDSRWTRNMNGSQYGGSLFAMTDPIYSLMLILILGDKYFVWDKEAEIEFKKPAIGPTTLECRVSEELLQKIKDSTEGGDKFFPVMVDNLYNQNREIVTTVKRKMYIRLKPAFRPCLLYTSPSPRD